MLSATMSVMGLYNFDNTLFDLLEVPEGVEKENVLIPNLVAELCELEVLYPSAPVLKTLIGVWSQKELPVWQKMYNTTVLDYDPISNYDRKEEWTENNTATSQTSDTTTSQTSDTTKSQTSDTTNHTTVVNNSQTNNVYGFDSIVAQPESNFTNSGEQETDGKGTSTSEGNGTRNTEEKGTSNTDTSNRLTKSGRAYGNIGVTTTQQMLTQERDIAKFNIYDFIIDSFKNRFCLMIY